MSKISKLRILNNLEMFFFLIVLSFRLQLIYYISSLDPFTRMAISSLYDYENGWGLYYCVLGFLGTFLIRLKQNSYLAWNLKQAAYLCILLSFGHNYWAITTLCIASLVFYNLKKVKLFFTKGNDKQLIYRWFFVPISIFLIVIEEAFPFLNY